MMIKEFKNGRLTVKMDEKGKRLQALKKRVINGRMGELTEKEKNDLLQHLLTKDVNTERQKQEKDVLIQDI